MYLEKIMKCSVVSSTRSYWFASRFAGRFAGQFAGRFADRFAGRFARHCGWYYHFPR